MREYQESVTSGQTDGQIDAGQSDPYVTVFAAMLRGRHKNNPLKWSNPLSVKIRSLLQETTPVIENHITTIFNFRIATKLYQTNIKAWNALNVLQFGWNSMHSKTCQSSTTPDLLGTWTRWDLYLEHLTHGLLLSVGPSLLYNVILYVFIFINLCMKF